MIIPDCQPRTTPRFVMGPVQVLAFVAFLLTLSLPLAAVALAGNTISGHLATTVGVAQAAETPTDTPTATPTATPTDTPTPTELPLSPTPTASSTPTVISFSYLPVILDGWPPPPTPTVITYYYLPLVLRGWPPPTPTPTRTPTPIQQGDPGFAYGIQAHMLWDDRELVADAVVDLGLSWVKQQVQWSDVEPYKGNYNWVELDKVVQAANSKGIRVLFSVVRTPFWALPLSCRNTGDCPPANLNDFGDFVAALADHFKDRGMAYEIWNEQNLKREWNPINACRYVDMLKIAYPRIKAADPGAMVISGGLTPNGVFNSDALDDRTYLQQMYDCGMRGWYDALGAHPSGYNNPPDALYPYWSDPTAPNFKNHASFYFRNTMEDYRAIMVAKGAGGRRIWITEFGWAVGASLHNYEYAADNTEEERAAWVVQAYQMAKNWGFVGVMSLWNLNFRIVAPNSEQALFGILEHDWAHTLTYDALRDMPK